MSTIKVLSIDGGGERGIVPVKFMELFCQQAGIPNNTGPENEASDIWKYFNVFAGSSVGSIIICAFAIGMSTSGIMKFFDEDGPWIFTTEDDEPSSRRTDVGKAAIIAGIYPGVDTFYPYDVPGIGTMRLKDKLTAVFGETKLSDLPIKVVITAFEKNDLESDYRPGVNTPVYFSNVDIPALGLTGKDAKVVDVCMASAAAPLYFAPYSFTLPGEEGPKKYIDGGVVDNNPAPIALAIGKAQNRGANRFCVLNPGTGLGDVGFPVYEEPAPLAVDPIPTNVRLVMYLIGAMTTGPQEINAKELDILANFTLDNLFNYRFNYYFDETYPDDPETIIDTNMDNTSEQIRNYYKTKSTAVYNSAPEQAKITNFIGHFTA